MPPEPLSLDRKDFFKERKHERSEPFRWRDSPSHHGQREFNRWGSADFRRHPDYGNGYTQPRPCDKMQEDGTCRPSISRGEGKYGRNSRENRGPSFSQRDWRGYSLETSNGSPNTPGRPHEVKDQRSIDDTSAYPSHTHFDFTNTGNQFPSKDQHDKIGVNASGTSQRCDKENPLGSLEWKTLKWARSGSLSSRGSGFSHSSSLKSTGGLDSSEAKVESLPKNVSPVQSPSGDAATFVTSASAPFEETTSRKKPRLKWGEGLAKYEKKKVDVPDEGLNSNVSVFSASNSEPVYGHGSSLSDKSPKINSFSDCASPATPSSVACSSSPGLEKLFVKTISNDDASNVCMSPDPGMQSHLGRFPFNLEKMDTSSIANLGSSLTELLQSDDSGPMDTSFVRSTAMSKLLIWKGDISKELEVTETEVDRLENELKSLKSECGESSARPAASSSLRVESNAKASHEQGLIIPRPAPLQIISCGDTTMEEMALCNGALEDSHADIKDEDIDSPGTATSKFVEPLALMNAVSPSGMGVDGECLGNLVQARTTNPALNCLRSGLLEKIGEPTCEDSSVLKILNAEPLSRDLSFHANEGMLCKLIMASNKESADQASEVFNKLMPCNLYKSDKSEGDSICQNEAMIREIFAMRKRFIRFKERAITLKFKALRHLWKEDLEVLSIKKHRSKSQRKLDSSLRTAQSGCHKQRSNIRPRLSSPGNSSMVPTAEIINYSNKIRLDSKVRPYRNALKMPSLILDKKEKLVSRFVTSNGLVEDPCAVEKERAMINPWTSEEKEIFMDKLAIFGKDFSKMASFLEHKTTADCVEFYYKNHKSDCFEKTKKKLDVRKQGKPFTSTYMVTSGKKWNRDINVASLDVLGAVSVMAAHTNSNMVNHHSGKFYLGDYSKSKVPQGDDGILERSSSFDLVNERETAAADVLAGICGSVSSEAMSSCITSAVDAGEGYCDGKYQKVDSTIKQPLIRDVTQHLGDETCSDESCGEMDSVDWTDEEKSIFIQAVSTYGKDFVKISRCVRTRSRDQCKVFFSKARKCLGLDLIHPRHYVGKSVSDDANGGGSGAEDARLVKIGPVVSKMEVDPPSRVTVSNSDVFEAVNNISQNCSEAAIPEECEMVDKSGLVSDGDKGSVDVSELVQAPQSAVTLIIAGDEGGQVTQQEVSIVESVSGPSSSNAVLVETVGASAAGGLSNKLEVQEALFSGCSEDENCNAGTRGPDSNLQCSAQDSNTVPSSPLLVAETSCCSGPSLNSENGYMSSLPSKSHVKLLQPGRSVATAYSSSLDSAVQCEKTLNQDRLSSTRDSESRDKQCRRSGSRNDCQQNLSGQLLVNRVESSPILRGYTLKLPCKEVTNRDDVSCVQIQGLSKSEGNFSNRQGCYLQKCSSSSSSHSVTPQNLEQTSDYRKSRSRSLSDTEKPSRNGDVKLFGTILTTPCSQQENDDKVANHHPKSCNMPSNMMFNVHSSTTGNSSSALLEFDRNNYLGLESIPMRNYGYWDGNKIQTGFSSLPAKYPAAFGKYPASSKIEQQGVMRSSNANECSLNRVSAFPVRESISGNGIVDYHVFRSLDVQPLTVDLKQRQDMLSEMQRRNGLESISSLQHQARVNVGTIPCTSISDPVEAIRMHYAKSERRPGA